MSDDCRQILVQLAYFAGIVDGEGCIGAYPIYKSSYSYKVLLKVGMTDPQPPQMLYRAFGGNFRVIPARNGNKPVFAWEIGAKKAADVLEILLPYLTVKQSKARSAIALARMHYTQRQRGADGRFPKLAIEDIAIRKPLYEALRNTGGRG